MWRRAWYMKFVWAVAFFWCACAMYGELTDIESGHSHYIPSLFAVIYSTLGKYPTVGFIIAFGIYLTVLGVQEFRKTRQSKL